MAQSGHPDTLNQCPLLGVKTSKMHPPMAASDPYRRFATRLRCGATDIVKRARCPALACLLAHGKAATTITSTSIPGRQKSVVRQARAGGLARSTHSFQTEL